LIFNLFGIFRQNTKDLPLKEYLEPEDYKRFLSEANQVLTEYGNDPKHLEDNNLYYKAKWDEYWTKRKEDILNSFKEK
jgi:hypothetical protein